MYEKEKFIIDFESLEKSEETFSFKLDDEYFCFIGNDEIHGGDIETTVKVSRKNGCFEVTFCSKGYVTVDCSRCLDPMRLPVDTEDTLFVKLGDEYVDEGDETITIPETDQQFDTSWHIYEFVALSIPAQHCHEEGECDEEMTRRLENVNSDTEDETASNDIDPRWAKLKELTE